VQSLGYLVYAANFKKRRGLKYEEEGCFSDMQSLEYLKYAAASKDRRGCLFLLYAASASYIKMKKAVFLICKGLGNL
jgi:hypothetical protein